VRALERRGRHASRAADGTCSLSIWSRHALACLQLEHTDASRVLTRVWLARFASISFRGSGSVCCRALSFRETDGIPLRERSTLHFDCNYNSLDLVSQVGSYELPAYGTLVFDRCYVNNYKTALVAAESAPSPITARVFGGGGPDGGTIQAFDSTMRWFDQVSAPKVAVVPAPVCRRAPVCLLLDPGHMRTSSSSTPPHAR
jgi:hypothetical protein